MVFIPVLPVRKYKASVGTTGLQLSLIHFTQLLTPSRCLGGKHRRRSNFSPEDSATVSGRHKFEDNGGREAPQGRLRTGAI